MMVDLKTISNPRTHYGDGKHATRAFRVQRITGVVAIAATAFFTWLMFRLAGADRAELVSVVAHPVVAIALIVTLIAVTAHMRIGMQEVIDDYAEKPQTHRLAGLANIVFAALIALIGIVSIVKLVFWG